MRFFFCRKSLRIHFYFLLTRKGIFLLMVCAWVAFLSGPQRYHHHHESRDVPFFKKRKCLLGNVTYLTLHCRLNEVVKFVFREEVSRKLVQFVR